MKKQGNISLHIEDRDMALVAEFRRKIRSAAILDLDSIFREIAYGPAPRFYVAEDRVLEMIRVKRLTGDFPLKFPLRRAMFAEIERRANLLVDSGEADNIIDAVYMTVYKPAPSFYLEPSTVKVTIYRTLKRIQLQNRLKRLASNKTTYQASHGRLHY